jgi:hypothetical protein
VQTESEHVDVPPPMTTNRISPRAQRGIGDCFASFSLREAFTGFLPARALPLNCSFLWRISREEVDCELSQDTDHQGERLGRDGTDHDFELVKRDTERSGVGVGEMKVTVERTDMWLSECKRS